MPLNENTFAELDSLRTVAIQKGKYDVADKIQNVFDEYGYTPQRSFADLVHDFQGWFRKTLPAKIISAYADPEKLTQEQREKIEPFLYGILKTAIPFGEHILPEPVRPEGYYGGAPLSQTIGEILGYGVPASGLRYAGTKILSKLPTVIRATGLGRTAFGLAEGTAFAGYGGRKPSIWDLAIFGGVRGLGSPLKDVGITDPKRLLPAESSATRRGILPKEVFKAAEVHTKTKPLTIREVLARQRIKSPRPVELPSAKPLSKLTRAEKLERLVGSGKLKEVVLPDGTRVIQTPGGVIAWEIH